MKRSSMLGKGMLIRLKTTAFACRIELFLFYFVCRMRDAREVWLGELKSYVLRDKYHHLLKNNV